MPAPLDYQSPNTPPPHRRTELQSTPLGWLAPTIVGAIALAIYLLSGLLRVDDTDVTASRFVARVLLDNVIALVSFYVIVAIFRVNVGHLALSLPRAAAIAGLLGASATLVPILGAGVGCLAASVLLCRLLEMELPESAVTALLLTGVKLGVWVGIGAHGWIGS